MVCVRLMRTLCWESSTLESLSFERWENYQTRILVMTGYVIGCPWYEFFFLFFHLPYFRKHYVHIRFHFSSYIQDISLCTLPHHPKSCSMFSLQVFVGYRGVKTDPNDLKWLLANHSHWLRWLRWVGSCDWYAWQSLHPRTKQSKERVVACRSETGAGMLPIWSGVDFFLWVF